MSLPITNAQGLPSSVLIFKMVLPPPVVPSSVNDNDGADIAPLDVTPCCATTVLANVTAEANVDPALTVKLSAASLPIVALPEDVKLSIERVAAQLADSRGFLSRVGVGVLGC